jgi:ribonuclease HII
MICGIDEAGRGPVIGPMVIAGVWMKNDEQLRKLGVRDSKKLSPQRRKKLAFEIDRIVGKTESIIIPAEDIDAIMKSMSLNDLELDTFIKIANKWKADKYYVDSVDVDEDRFGRRIGQGLKFDAEVISKHGADDLYPIVSASSIIAKVRRDEEIEKISAMLEKKLNMPMGSGYPSDATTINFLKEWVNRFGKLPPHIRHSWKTVERLINKNL